MACLLITTGPQAGTYYPLGKRTLSVGRDPAREIQLRDPKVSRKHFLVRWESGAYVALELRSKNGITINGQRTKERALQDFDEIKAGDTVLVYHDGDEPGRVDGLCEYKRASPTYRVQQTVSG